MDVCIIHPNAPSNLKTPVNKLLLKNEAEKKKKFGSNVTNNERAYFIPLVFTNYYRSHHSPWVQQVLQVSSWTDIKQTERIVQPCSYLH